MSRLTPLAAALAPSASAADLQALEDALRAGMEKARQTWPSLQLPEEEFARFVGERLPDGPPTEALAALELCDLYLAFGCVRQDAAALRILQETVLPDVARVVDRVSTAGDLSGEVQQRLWEKAILGSEGKPPRILEYLGQGPLVGWLAAVAVRLAQSLLRGQERERPLPVAVEPLTDVVAPDPELELIRVRFKADFQQAFTESLAELSPRDVSLLRLHLVDGLNIDRLGVIYSVHRATIARWIAAARGQLVNQTRERLKQRLQLGSDTLNSLMRVVDSQLELSLQRLLAKD